MEAVVSVWDREYVTGVVSHHLILLVDSHSFTDLIHHKPGIKSHSMD